MTEHFYIVDSKDNPMCIIRGKDDLHDGPDNKPYFHRSVHVLVEIYGGTTIIQKKGLGTENAGKWSSAASGHVRAYESYQTAAHRELLEELGIEAPVEELLEIGKIDACDETGNEFVHVFGYLMDPNKESIKLDEEEVAAAAIVSMSGLLVDIRNNPDKYSKPFIMALNLFTSMGGGL